MRRILWMMTCLAALVAQAYAADSEPQAEKNKIVIAAPGTDGFPMFASGAIPLTVNVSNSASPVEEMTYTCTVGGKKFASGKKLTQRTGQTWKDILYLNSQHRGKTVSIRVTAIYRNGERSGQEVTFVYANRKPLTDLTENWKNLLGNPEHIGIAEKALTPPLRMAWTNNVGARIGRVAPVIYKGNVYIATLDAQRRREACIYALSGQTGDVVWKYYVDGSIHNSIAVENDQVYAQTEKGTLIAVDAKDGHLKWGKQLHVNEGQPLTEGLVVEGNVLYAGTGLGLCAVDAALGEKIWRNSEWSQSQESTATLTLGRGMVIGSARGRGLYGNDARTGQLKWQLDRNGLADRASSAAIHDNLLYITSGRSLFIIDPEKGTVIVRKEYPFSLDVASTPLVTDQEILFGSATNGLIAVDKETLEIKWQFPTGAAVETSPVLSGQTVYFGASDGTLYGVDKSTGAEQWRYITGAPILGSVALSGNTLVAADAGGNVYAFTVQ